MLSKLEVLRKLDAHKEGKTAKKRRREEELRKYEEELERKLREIGIKGSMRDLEDLRDKHGHEFTYKRQLRLKKRMRRMGEKFIKRHLRSATHGDYSRLLMGYLERGGEITDWRDDENLRGMWVAPADFRLPNCGMLTLRIIIPADVNVDIPYGIGDASLYFMKDFSVYEGSEVPIFRDVWDDLRSYALSERPEGIKWLGLNVW